MPDFGVCTNVLLTRSPLYSLATIPFDLHDLSVPPAFILSQNQTLLRNLSRRALLPGLIESFAPTTFAGIVGFLAESKSSCENLDRRILVNYMKLTMFLPCLGEVQLDEDGLVLFSYFRNSRTTIFLGTPRAIVV
jgi:hypothetical protein